MAHLPFEFISTDVGMAVEAQGFVEHAGHLLGGVGDEKQHERDQHHANDDGHGIEQASDEVGDHGS